MTNVQEPMIRVGPAGWNYPDWYGVFYPEKRDKSFKELDFLADFFDMAEINSTFYRPANAFMGRSWVMKTAKNPDFKFTAKLWSRFTHDRQDFGTEEIRLFTAGIDPLYQAGKLGALLCQFPWSFRNDETNRKWLDRVLDVFSAYPLVVEVRHSGWDRPEIAEWLDRRGVGLAAIDQPVIGQSIPFKPVRTGPIGYVRMHGRNAGAWFAKPTGPAKENPSARYDYLYGAAEVEEITATVKAVAKGTKETYVVQNNHPRGQAVANALQVRRSLGQAIRDLPDSMFLQYPFLR
jgi:uncharacterized protein YecE (DUF72 family)